MHPARVRDAMAVAGQDVEGLAVASGLRIDRLDDVLAGRRRLGVAAMRVLAVPLGVDWWALRCDRLKGQRPCPACAAPNVVTDTDLNEVAHAMTQLLAEAQANSAADVAGWRVLPGFAAARAALIAIGGDLDLEEVGVLGVTDVLAERDPPPDLIHLGQRLAAFCGRGDVATEEIVGLDIDIAGTVPSGLRIAGWDLIRYNKSDLDHFDVIVGGTQNRWAWDHLAAAYTWWLRRDEGKRPPRHGTIISFTEPRHIAVAPLLALALVRNEPPSAISHGEAQKGCGVTLSVMSRQLDYIVEDDGYVEAQYGPYRLDADCIAEWKHDVTYVGNLVEQVFLARTRAAQRYIAAAEQFVAVSADLYRGGWKPLPRLALELSTVAEMLLLSGANEGEVSRRVRVAAGWLGGIDDPDRETIHDFMKTVYDAGSKYRHGGHRYVLYWRHPAPAARKRLDVLRAYALLRRLMLHGLAVVASQISVADLCDQVQRTVAARDQLEEIVTTLYAHLAITPQRFDMG